MRHSDHAAAAALLMAGWLTLAAGCTAVPRTPLQESYDRTVSRLSSRCFWELDGERYVLGGDAVFAACRRWAEKRAGIRLPGYVRTRPH